MDTIILDNTKRSTFTQCRRKYYYQHLHGLQSINGSSAIRYGVGYHKIQEVYHKLVMENGWPEDQNQQLLYIGKALEAGKETWEKETAKKNYFEDYRNFNTLVQNFNAYLEYFKDDYQYMKIIGTETIFECPIVPESKEEEKILSNLPDVLFTGKIDQTVKMDSQRWIFDFKTTGWNLDQVISKANRSPQFIGYSYAGKRVLDFEPNGCLASFTQVSAYKSKKTGEYNESKFDFRRMPQIYTDADIRSWKMSFITTAKDIYQCTLDNNWIESFDNCYQYGVCPYLKLCQQHLPIEELNTEQFVIDFWDVRKEID